MTSDDSKTIVRALLDTAQLAPSEEEFLRFVDVYPVIRAQADSLYLPELEPEAPSLHFDPTVGYQ